ncbi:MAG TPA: lycopene cyclase domain-containing protein, partial [Chitinophagaceae bacterium]|nr:lycopene cyclase domain-containing protein [Chitinophagaceae bacterium]
VWDGLFTQWGVWSFNPQYVLGIYCFGMPLEEYLFFLCIPYACVFSYYCFDLLFRFDRFLGPVKLFYIILVVVLFAAGLWYTDRLYTSVTFILCAVVLALLLKQRAPFLPTFFFCFLFILVPFILSNGVLTGSFFNRIVVRYNDAENLGIRILTIPFEDTFYGMLLLLLNVWGYEYMRRRAAIKNPGYRTATGINQ